MKKTYIKKTMLFMMLLFYSFSEGQNLLHYWNFNNNASVSAITAPSQSNIVGGSLTANLSGITAIDFAGGTGQNFSVLNLNARNSDAAGTHLRFNDPIGSSLVFALPTTGYENAIMKFATRRSGSGAGTQVWSYSTDGTNYTFFTNITPNNGDPGLATLDFSSISAADNNPNFKLKVEFQQGAGGTVGNNRFDNFTAEGTLLSGSDTAAPTVTFSPLNSATNVVRNVNPTIAFNESVRFLNNDAITNTTVDAVVELRLNNASGTLVPFDATFASNTITIVPTTLLNVNQVYYVALLANTIEDLSNNAITTLQSTTYTTAKSTVTLSVSSNSGTEVGTTLITVTATADVAVNGDQTLNLGVTGANITAGDYTLSNAIITLLSGQTSGSVTFTVVNDVLVEGSEIATLTISNPSNGILIGTTNTQTVTITDIDAALNIDLSTYVRVGRYDLPEPTRTAHPANNLLCQEASAVTYNWDTDTLFITADGSTSITQVSKTGQLIDTMTMAQGGSPQGTDFYDTEGLTYIGNGQFVMSEERDRQLVKFTYAAGTTLSRANTQTVKIGTFVPNTGTEGLSYDPLTGGYIVLKEITPIGIFQTGVDFNAGTATNGSATTENSTNLFDPALLGFSDVADVFALSNIPALNGQSLYNNLLVLGQENAKVVNVDRSGVIVNSLTIVSDAGNPLDVASQQHEGLTMDRDGRLYIVSENGGGTIDYPQLWVYAASTVPNQAPTAIALTNTTTAILENSNTTAAVKVADITVTDDGLGTNNLTLSGADASSFQITGSSLYIKAGTVIDFETKTSYNVTINVDDTTIGNTPDASVNYVLDVTDVLVETTPIVSVSITEAASWSSSTTNVGADWFEVTNNGNAPLDITGWKVDDSSNSFTAALALTGITSIASGESVIFLETTSTNAATIIANFKSAWFGSNVPAGLQVGSYTGGAIGLSSGGDAVNLFNAAGVIQSNISFGAATTNFTFNNAASLTNSVITTLSQVGVNDAFAAANDTVQIGSPGTIGKLFISEVAPWSSGNSPVGADWFEVTNTKAVAVDITGWKVDDNSQSPAAAVALNGITSINPGESVIFMETADLAGKTTAFINNWFGTNPSSGIRIGNYTGTGIGFGTGGDQVNLYNGLSSTPVSSVLFGASPATAPFTTFDNAIGQNSLVTPITQFSAVGTKGAFIAANSATEIGSPGTFVTAPCPTITAIAAASSTVNCNSATTSVVVTATGGTAPYTGTGSFTVGAGSYSYTVTDAKGCTAVTTVTVTNIADTTNPTIYFQPAALLTGATGPSTTQTPYLQSQSIGGKYTSILSVNDAVGGYKMVGIPDGLGAYDNNNGTFTLLMNHELGNTAGIARAHGSAGAFVSKWVINKSDLAVQSGSDLIQTVNTWNTTSNSFVTGTTAFNRFCSADLPSVSALYNPATGLGTQERIFLTGEESGAEGRAFGHIATGATAGVTYELPYLGKFSWENVVASPATGNKTVVAGTDDNSTNGQVYFYVGTKTNTGTEIDKAGLNNGKLFGVNVTGLASESTSSIPAANTAFTLSDLGFVQNKTGATLNTESVTAGVTNFLRPEDGGFDPSNPNDFYFVTTNSITAPSRMWRMRFNDIANLETGGTITAVLDGTEGQKMLDNMTIDKLGHILLQEDPGGNAHNAKMWQYTIATDALELVGKHDAARFGEVVGGVTTAATSPYTNDEESSGVIDMSDILGPGMFLIDDQAHYTTGLANLTEVVQGGQLLAFFNPASVSATVSNAAQAAISVTSCSATAVALGTPATADNCSVVNLTNNAPTTFPIGTTTVTWTATDASGNTATATQTVTVTTLPAATVDLSVSASTASETTGTVVTVTATTSAALCFDETIAVDVTGTDITAADYTLSNATITIPAGSTTGSVTFTVVSDNAVEALETAVVTISNPSSGLALGTTTTQNIAISDFAFTLQVLHASDFEGAVEAVQDAPRFAAIVDQLEESYVNTIKLSSGDNYIPGPFLSSGEDSSLSAALKTSYESYYNTTFSSSSVSLLPSIGRADISILNFIGIEASALGNHEFDLGTTEVRNIIRGANNTAATIRTWFGAQFPYLSSNLNFSGDSNLSAIATTDRLRLNTSFMSNPTEAVTAITNKSKLAPSTIIMKGGQKIGIVGCTTQVLASISSPGATTVVGGGANDMTILAGFVQPVVNSLIAEGCNKIILLSHLQQIAFEKELAGKLTGVDIIMAGGSNTLMADADDRLRAGDVAYESYPFLTTGLDGKALALINTDGNYKYVGRLVVDFDVDGTLIPSSINSLVSGVYAADAQGLNDVWGANVANAYAVGTRGYQVQLLCNAIGNVIIAKDGNLFGRTSVFLEGRRNFVRTEETNIGNVSAEANLWLAKFYDPTTVISIKNGGGIRSAIGNVIAVGDDVTYAPPIANPSAGKQSGDISQLDIENSLRFNNQLSLVTLTASGLRSVLEHAVNATTATATPGQFAQVAGVRYSYNLSNASGSKILNAVITDEAGNIVDTLVVNGVTVGNLSRTFRVVTLNFLAGGGDSYPFNTLGTSRSDLNTLSEQGPAAASFTNAGSEQDAFAEYMKNQFSATPYGITDTPLTQDCRIQRIPARADNVLPSSAGSNGTVTICNGSTITAVQLFAALGGTPVAGGTWSPALTGAGIYTYTVTSPSCAGSASATVTVTEGSIIIATATPIASTVCTGATTTVSVTATGGTSPYTITGSSLTAGAGTYNYIVTDAKGCTATTSVTITETAVSENVSNISACDSYTWNETTYTSSGLYTGTTTNCVTEKLNLTITPSSLIAEPTNPTICKLTGAIATTKVIAASGSTYKWYTQTASGTTWAALVNSANYVGIDEAELKITRTTTTVPANGTKYKVVVSNICGNVTSTTVALQEQTVLSKTAVVSVVGTLSPTLTACQGGNVNLSLAAGSVGNIQWQSSTDGITYANVGASIAQSALSANNLVMSFNTAALTQTTWFRIVASNGVCSSVASTAVKITVSSPVTTGSINGGGVTVCAPLATGIDANGNALTAAITNSTALTLSDYTVGATILWQKSTNYVNSTNASPVWATAGSTTNTFTASALTLDTWYRAQVTNGACKDFTVPVKIAVSPSAKTGVITSAASVCTGGDITFTSAAYTGTSIQWEVSTTSATTGFQTVSGENGLVFNMNNVTYAPLSKFYVRNVVTSGTCTLARSAVKTITVNPLSVSGTVKGGGTICSGSNRTLLVAGNIGTIQWQSSTNGTDFVNVPSIVGTAGVNYASGSATGIAATYIVSNITADTYFRAKITSGLCSVAYSNVVEYNIGTTAVSGEVSALSSTICPATGTTLTLGNSVGSVQWQKATISATTGLPGAFTNISGQTGTTLATGNLTASTAYQAVVTIGSCSSVTATYASVFVVAKPIAKTITSVVISPAGGLTTPLCTNDPKKTLTIGAGYTGAIQWQRSTTSTTAGFTDIAGATGASYIVANPSSGANFYRATFTNTCGVIAISAPVTIYFKNCSSSARVAATKEEVEMTFNVFAYPNPFSDNFKLSLESPSNDKVNVAVFDLSGKLIEQREINSNEINALDLGNNYPSGVFNVIVNQGTNNKIVRVVKQ
jgi:uncharacterized protein YjiK/2',3'-cyclic-nucleotide 2'-phosphodiesterase (5'-nucleotidase family)